MNTVALLPALVLAALAGVCLLAALLWYRFIPALEDGAFGIDDRGIRVLRYGGAAGVAVFGGFLLASGLYVAAVATGATAPTGEVAATFRTVAVGLLAIALAALFGTGAGCAVEVVRARRDAVR